MMVGEFKTLARAMRAAQREYFKTRSPDVLERSKKLEKEFDAALLNGNDTTGAIHVPAVDPRSGLPGKIQPQGALFGNMKPGHAQ